VWCVAGMLCRRAGRQCRSEGRTAMDALGQSAPLIRRGAELRGQSMRIRAAAAETVENCGHLIAAAAATQESVIPPMAESGLRARERPQRMSCPRTGNSAPVECRVRLVAS
jgi:hypothetical protein